MILNSYSQFLDKLFIKIKNSGINVNNFELDHIAYRPSSSELYEQKKLDLNNYGEMISEIEESGRKISIFKLTNPLIFNNFSIQYFELMGPKELNKYKDGYQHIEFVIDSTLEIFITKYSNLTFNTAHIDGKINPSIELEFDDKTSVEFHLKNIGEVVKLQKQNIS